MLVNAEFIMHAWILHNALVYNAPIVELHYRTSDAVTMFFYGFCVIKLTVSILLYREPLVSNIMWRNLLIQVNSVSHVVALLSH